MIPSLALRLLGITAPAWLTKPIRDLFDALTILLIFAAVFFAIHHSGEKAGETKVTAKTEKAHAAAVASARQDERTAQTVADKIGATTAHTNDLATQFAQAKIEDMHNAINAVPAPAPGAALPAAPVDSMRDNLNAIGDRAERAAEAADALP